MHQYFNPPYTHAEDISLQLFNMEEELKVEFSITLKTLYSTIIMDTCCGIYIVPPYITKSKFFNPKFLKKQYTCHFFLSHYIMKWSFHQRYSNIGQWVVHTKLIEWINQWSIRGCLTIFISLITVKKLSSSIQHVRNGLQHS